MCGRITYYISPAEIVAAFRLFDTDGLDALEARYNLPPTGSVACVRLNTESADREAFVAKWGLIPSWAKDEKIGHGCSNARANTVDTKPAFRSAYKRQRCLVAASGFYEWDQVTPLAKGEKKQPYYFTMADSSPMTFAGLWEFWKPEGNEPVTSCTIITTDPNELMAPLHDRLPVILPSDLWDVWLDPDADPKALKGLLVPIESDALQCWPVTKDMNATVKNKQRNDSPEFIKPIQLGKTLV